ncbi:MAG: ABC transporter ATP-binding protein [Chloroflexi bacterium]|nr:ABC transporter ATP-binding protein [Chloroflexota bacterium]
MKDSNSPSDIVLRTVGLSRSYGRLVALDALDLEVRRGCVYGFLGPNGAGKTTAINLILGLIRANAGHVELFGLDMRTDQPQALRRTGSILEGQAYYPLLSARDNLRIWSAVSDVTSDSRIDEVLELVQLSGRAGDKLGTYSQGMKQRLGLATALLHDPELLVLDEPTNGLDPAGMRDFRGLIRELAGMGKTVFVSSHLLGEVELMCDDVGIVKHGRLLTQGPVADLVRQGQALELQVTDTARAVEVLNGIDWVGSVVEQDGRLVVDAPRERAADLSRALAEQQIYLSELRPRDGSLEDFFLEVTGEPDAEG